MTLLSLFDELDEAISSGTNSATLRNRLLLIREQAEAIESQLEAAQFRVEQLQADLEKQQVAPKEAVFDEVAEKILEQFFDAGRAFPIEKVAHSLGLPRSMADYHMDALSAAEMVELCSYHPGQGTLYVLTPKGRAHVVTNRKT